MKLKLTQIEMKNIDFLLVWLVYGIFSSCMKLIEYGLGRAILFFTTWSLMVLVFLLCLNYHKDKYKALLLMTFLFFAIIYLNSLGL